MLENLEWYMEQEVVPLKGDFPCPVGMLGDVQINFIHYETFDQGVSKWEERKSGFAGIIYLSWDRKKKAALMK